MHLALLCSPLASSRVSWNRPRSWRHCGDGPAARTHTPKLTGRSRLVGQPETGRVRRNRALRSSRASTVPEQVHRRVLGAVQWVSGLWSGSPTRASQPALLGPLPGGAARSAPPTGLTAVAPALRSAVGLTEAHAHRSASTVPVERSGAGARTRLLGHLEHSAPPPRRRLGRDGSRRGRPDVRGGVRGVSGALAPVLQAGPT